MSEIIKKAREEISRICNKGSWKMCIPPDQKNDSDFIFSKVCDLAEDRYSEMIRLQNCNLEHGRKIQELEAFKKEALELLKILERDTHPDEYGVRKLLKKYEAASE